MNVSLFLVLGLALVVNVASAEPASWVFHPGTFTHDPTTGARVAQYQRTPAVEPLTDPRQGTSRYRRIRTNLRGTDGSVDSTYEVQSFANGQGGLDAEWERFHDAWRQSLLTGSYYYRNQPVPYGSVYGYPGDGYNPTYGATLPNGAFGDPRFSSPYPPQGYPHYSAPSYGPPGQGYPAYGQAPYGHPPHRYHHHGTPAP